MLAILAATSAGFLGVVEDPASVRYCVVAAEARQANEAAENGADYFMAVLAGEVAQSWRARAKAIGADDGAALASARSELTDSGPGGIGYLACDQLVSAAPAGGDLVEAARQLDAIGEPVPMGGPVPIGLAPIPVMKVDDPDFAVVPGQNNVLACYALLATLAAAQPVDSDERKAFEQGAASLAEGWSINLYASRGGTRTYKDDLAEAAAGFDVAAFEALSETEGEKRMSFCFRKAGIE